MPGHKQELDPARDNIMCERRGLIRREREDELPP